MDTVVSIVFNNISARKYISSAMLEPNILNIYLFIYIIFRGQTQGAGTHRFFSEGQAMRKLLKIINYLFVFRYIYIYIYKTHNRKL